MSDSTLWWLLTGAAVVAELVSGTFYLLMLAVGAMAGALTAHAGASLELQLVVAGMVGAAAVFVCYLLRKRSTGGKDEQDSRDVHLDVGETVQVEAWNPDRTAHVQYRGARWSAVLRGDAEALPGAFKVVELDGNRLVLDKA